MGRSKSLIIAQNLNFLSRSPSTLLLNLLSMSFLFFSIFITVCNHFSPHLILNHFDTFYFFFVRPCALSVIILFALF